MIQNAIVKRVVNDEVVQVSLLRQMECGLHCDGSCEGCSQKPKEEILALASNPIGAQPGDHVEVEPAVGHNIGTSLLVFLLPCVGLGAGYVVGQAALQLGEIAALGTAFVGLVLGFIPAFLLNRSISSSKAPEFHILKFLS
ncbi:MAG: SoxR reducing system RseC family protein [Lawsonibacter sp.]|jgi:positive regulator of sigma E activity